MVFCELPCSKCGKMSPTTGSKTAVDIHISNGTVSNKKRIKLLGINLEGKLNFDFHVDTLLKKGH